jgi:hypothetical protein
VIRELLGLCRREGISTALFVTPEGSEFQSWYSPSARAAVAAYLSRLSVQEGVAIMDARDWVSDCFSDGHHLLPVGAAKFTERLGREVIQPMLNGCQIVVYSNSGPDSVHDSATSP